MLGIHRGLSGRFTPTAQLLLCVTNKVTCQSRGMLCYSARSTRAGCWWKELSRRKRHMQIAPGFVGDKTPLAQEYHDSDFDFKEHERYALPLLMEQISNSQPVNFAAKPGDNSWESFYQRHPKAKFFKERRYLVLEFPSLCIQEPLQHIVEIGCGCGSSILPVLKANSTATATVTDISATSVAQLHNAAEQLGIDACRLRSFVADATEPSAAEHFMALQADAVLIMFTLSAVMPDQMKVMLQHAFTALRPGGCLCIRDHGLYDMVQLRLPPESRIGTNLYRLLDGTISYFFSTQDLEQKAIDVGFTVVECKYVCVINRNKRTGQELKRVFVHAILCKPNLPVAG